MSIEKTELDGVLKISPSTFFKDFRGEYIETYNKDFFKKNNINIEFTQDDISVSKKNVLRGVHGDFKTWKLVTCLHGSFFLVVVNNDENSSQYKKSISFTLTDKNRELILIPPKFGNGHVVLSQTAIFHYKQNTNYDRSSQFTIKWNDSNYNFGWPIEDPILSERDK
jgi:dTDP-4-dehydrorhamnose 3,5-epimerase